MKLLTNEIASLVAQTIRSAQESDDLPDFELPVIDIKPPKRPEQGDYAAAVAMQLAKPAKLNPLQLANTIAAQIPTVDFIAAVEVVPPGFINFRLNDAWLKQQVENIISEGEALFTLDYGKGKRAQVEFVSANPTGPLHVGRSRGAIVGDSIARILEAAGYDVEREYYFNNAGVQMENLGNSLRLRYLQALGEPVEIPTTEDKTFYHGEYLVDFANSLVAEQGEALKTADWHPFKEYAEKQMFNIIQATLDRVNIKHDVFFNENSLYDTGAVWDTFKALQEQGYIYESVNRENETDKPVDPNAKPAKWFRSTQLGDMEDRVLVKADGNPTYTLPDIAYHQNKIERGFDVLVNVLGADHFVQHQVVRYGVQALGLDASKIHVIIIQMVRLLRDGQIQKMSTRAGDIETLDQLIDETSADAVRYLLLARSPDSQLDFDLNLAVAQNNENPVYYIQNAHVRCAGIFRQAQEAGLDDDGADLSLLGADELRFIRKALELGDIIEFSAVHMQPHKIAFFAHELANTFHPIYDAVRALHGDVPADVAKARLRFYRAAQVTFKRLLDLMGMSAPEYM